MEKLKNQEIKAQKVILINSDGKNIGKFLLNDALYKANEDGLDLVQFNDDEIPVCKILDYQKLKYEYKKLMKKNKNNNPDNKELSFRPNTFINDLQRLINQAQKFIDGGDNVRFVVKFKGREVSFAYKAIESFNHIENEINLPKGYNIKRDDVVSNNRMIFSISK